MHKISVCTSKLLSIRLERTSPSFSPLLKQSWIVLQFQQGGGNRFCARYLPVRSNIKARRLVAGGDNPNESGFQLEVPPPGSEPVTAIMISPRSGERGNALQVFGCPLGRCAFGSYSHREPITSAD